MVLRASAVAEKGQNTERQKHRNLHLAHNQEGLYNSLQPHLVFYEEIETANRNGCLG